MQLFAGLKRPFQGSSSYHFMPVYHSMCVCVRVSVCVCVVGVYACSGADSSAD